MFHPDRGSKMAKPVDGEILQVLCQDIVERKGRNEMESKRWDGLSETQKATAAQVAKRYRKTSYDWNYVERKVRARWQSLMAEYILHLYYNG
jgi:hypothetical protein